jgi:RNA polymerase sigma factor (TIGR02999 family)
MEYFASLWAPFVEAERARAVDSGRFPEGVGAMPASGQLTDLLNAARLGDADAAEQAYDIVYAELRQRAGQSLRRMPGATLTPTALVHETYLRLSDYQRNPVRDRSHFFALAARAMRQIVIEHARRRGAQKRGGDQRPLELEAAWDLADTDLAEVLEIDTALRALEQSDADLARLVELYFFAGLTFDEIAEMTDRSERTVRRNWELAKAFLRRELQSAAP